MSERRDWRRASATLPLHLPPLFVWYYSDSENNTVFVYVCVLAAYGI